MKREIDRLISEFQLPRARELLKGIRIESVPLSERSDYAHLCRRAGLYKLALKFVYKQVHESKRPTSNDLLEYASCLRRVGLTQEALRTLKRMPVTAKTLLHQAFCHIQHWDYHHAAELVLEVLQSNPSEPESRTARVNLAACLAVLGDLDSCEKWLNDLEVECERRSLHLLLNCFEIRSQVHIARNDFQGAKILLHKADALMPPDTDGSTKLLLKKWRWVVEIHQDPSVVGSADFQTFKDLIRASGHWESLRSLDWEVARALGDRLLAAKVYFGTPFMAFRRQILESELGRDLPDHILRTDGRWSGCGEEVRLINGLTGQNMPFKFGTIPYRTSLLMLSDHYQPWTVYRLFNGLFGEESFDPFHSPNRVYQLMDRIRNEIKKNQLPLELHSSKHGFRLRPRNEGAVVIFDEMCFLSQEEMILRLLKLRFQKRPFKLKDVKGLIPLSSSQIARAIRKLIQDEALENIAGQSKVHRYLIKAS